MARSGFVVYEGGNSVFDESVLVHLARPKTRWPQFDICDHIGRSRGSAVSEDFSSPFQARARGFIYDTGDNEVLRIEARPSALRTTVTASGAATGLMVSEWNRMGNLALSHNGEPYGEISGGRHLGLTASTLRVLDHRGSPVGAIKVFEEGTLFKRLRHYVVWVEPTLRGELRRMLAAMPLAIDLIRHRRAV